MEPYRPKKWSRDNLDELRDLMRVLVVNDDETSGEHALPVLEQVDSSDG